MARTSPSGGEGPTVADIAYNAIAWELAACRAMTRNLFFPTWATSGHTVRSRVVVKKRKVPRQIANVCASCAIQTECARWGIHHELYGIWGGLSDSDRETLRIRYGISRRAPNTARVRKHGI